MKRRNVLALGIGTVLTGASLVHPVSASAIPAATTEAAVVGSEFYTELLAEAKKTLGTALKADLSAVDTAGQGDFPYLWQNSDKFNDATYRFVSARLKAGAAPGSVTFQDGDNFPDIYQKALDGVSFELSTKDNVSLDKALAKGSAQGSSIVSSYENKYGTITKEKLGEAAEKIDSTLVANKLDYILNYILGYKWSGKEDGLSWGEMKKARDLKALLPKAPATGDAIIALISKYLGLIAPGIALGDQVRNGNRILDDIKGNILDPSNDPDKLETFDEGDSSSKGYHPKYVIKNTPGGIDNDLETASRKFSLRMAVSSMSDSKSGVSINGKAGFTVGKFLTFTTKAGASFDMSKAAGSGAECAVNMDFVGYSLVPIEALAFRQANRAGWFATDPLKKAAANWDKKADNKRKDVTGYKFQSPAAYKLTKPVAEGGDFGRLTSVLVSNYPTITIKCTKSSYSYFEKNWDQKVSGNLKLFGLFSLGSFSEGAYASKLQAGSSDSEYTVAFGPSEATISIADPQKTAYVIGGVVSSPLAP